MLTQEEDSQKEPEQAFEEYCDKVEETAAWGGQVELQALAQAIERHITVFCAGLPLVEMGVEYKGKALSAPHREHASCLYFPGSGAALFLL